VKLDVLDDLVEVYFRLFGGKDLAFGHDVNASTFIIIMYSLRNPPRLVTWY
jgi:hypothetical protein